MVLGPANQVAGLEEIQFRSVYRPGLQRRSMGCRRNLGALGNLSGLLLGRCGHTDPVGRILPM